MNLYTKISVLSLITAKKLRFLYLAIYAFPSLTYGQNINRIDAHIWEEYAQKKHFPK